jgi:hypothetical protein
MARLQGVKEGLGINKNMRTVSVITFVSKKKSCKKSKCSKWKGGQCKCGRG